MVAKTPPLSFKLHHLLTGQEKRGKGKIVLSNCRVQKRLQKRRITFCRALWRLQQGKRNQKALGVLSETSFEKAWILHGGANLYLTVTS